MRNSYGNYVFQKSLALARGIDKFKIIDVIFKNFPTIQDQKIKMKWIKLLKKNIKQEDVFEADAEQDSLNLRIDEMINYSHKYKLINDELSRYDSNPGKKDKAKANMKKKPGAGYEGSIQDSYASGASMQYSQQYQPVMYGSKMPPMGGPVYSSNSATLMKEKPFEKAKATYQGGFMPPMFMPPPPPPMGFAGPIPQYQYPPMNSGMPMMGMMPERPDGLP
mmetsp:Transcript_12342/g.14103  ORF Transcript_12342/g.14103 Transcript_12342/m.14103 type:complete len:221 (-) Transcript_12342:159-821(-)